MYFANITRNIEKTNYNLKNKIDLTKSQININEIEYSLYTSYDYLTKIQKTYFENVENKYFDNRVSFNDFKNSSLENYYTVGIAR